MLPKRRPALIGDGESGFYEKYKILEKIGEVGCFYFQRMMFSIN